jgi:choline kinase
LPEDNLKAVLLAAGVGRRLSSVADHPPKALVRFGGKSLLRRHLEILTFFDVAEIAVVAGYKIGMIAEEVAASGLGERARLIENQRYTEGSIVSLWTALQQLAGQGPLLLMDADVLYDYRLMGRLVTSPIPNCLLLDRDIEPGDEPVKLCVAGERIVDFHKQPKIAHDWHGESVGFFRFTAASVAELAIRTEAYVAGGKNRLEYEEPIRDMILAGADGAFGFEDITGLPWTEIDFPVDVRRAEREIFPKLQDPRDLDAALLLRD